MYHAKIRRPKVVQWTPDGSPDVVEFTVEPLSDLANLEFMARMERVGPPEERLKLTLSGYTLTVPSAAGVEASTELCVQHVSAWTNLGDEEGGPPLACTDVNRRRFFGQNGGARKLVLEALGFTVTTGASSRPNGSGGGSDSSSTIPTSPVRSGTEAGADVTTPDASSAQVVTG